VYAADARGQLLILDAAKGTRLATLPLAESTVPLVNQQTDRIYLASESGLIQCLHEIALTEPLRYVEPEKPASDERKPTPSTTEEPRDEPSGANAADEAPEKEDPAEPRAEAEEPAAEAEVDERDPFEP
jgi:hypothetical protein